VRVIAGDFKGRRLSAPKGTEARPTADRVKEAIFSMIESELPGSVCLDLFAGSGALGIEALSRGAARVYFCDTSPASLAVIRNNLDHCRVDSGRAVVLARDWRVALSGLSEKCNLVFIDAPYNMCEHYSQILEKLVGSRVLESGAMIVIEKNASGGPYNLPERTERVREKRYGNVGVDLLIYDDTGEKND